MKHNPHTNSYAMFRVTNGEQKLELTTTDPSALRLLLANNRRGVLDLTVTGPGDEGYSEPMPAVEWFNKNPWAPTEQ